MQKCFFSNSKTLVIFYVHISVCVYMHTYTYCPLCAWLVWWNSSTLQNSPLLWVRLWTQMSPESLPFWDRSRVTGEPLIEPSRQLRMNLALAILQKTSLHGWEILRVSFVYTTYFSEGKYDQWLFRNGIGSTMITFQVLGIKNRALCTPGKGFTTKMRTAHSCPDWDRICDLPFSVSQVQGLQAYTTLPNTTDSYVICLFWNKVSCNPGLSLTGFVVKVGLEFLILCL